MFNSEGTLLYVINELQSSVTTYAYDAANGGLRELSTISTPAEWIFGRAAAAEIALHPSGKFLYASNRGPDSIAVFSIAAEGSLRLVEFVPVDGKTPRNFAIDPTGSWLLVGDQESDKVVVFRINQQDWTPHSHRAGASDQFSCVRDVCALP